jgi:hypothetical protein
MPWSSASTTLVPIGPKPTTATRAGVRVVVDIVLIDGLSVLGWQQDAKVAERKPTND